MLLGTIRALTLGTVFTLTWIMAGVLPLRDNLLLGMVLLAGIAGWGSAWSP